MAENLYTAPYAPYCEVKLEGKLLSPAAVISVSLDLDLNAPDMVDITINEGLDIDSQKFTWLDNPILNPGKKVDIFFGYANKKKNCLFKGTINSLSPSFPSSGVPQLTVKAYDFSHMMQTKFNDFNTVKVKYSDIASELAGKNGLSSGGVESTLVVHDMVDRSQGQSDYHLLKELASKLNYEFFVREKKLFFRKPKDKKIIQTFEYKKSIISFSPRLTTASIPPAVVVSGWNENKKERVEGKASLGDVVKDASVSKYIKKFVSQAQGSKPKGFEADVEVNSKEEAKRRAELELKKLADKFIEGDLEVVGDPTLVPGNSVKLKGLGELFSGNYYILTAKHAIRSSGYTTNLGLRRVI